ncbi:uncharacterized protein TRIADDRAFT_58882 [Trichoplax adhaerens]|uniref:DUF4614 domain-containing protein n=1 Tax=Trichoplax adhaerens TaxID=10228 RepID=B3S3X7_TRIAD|nr:hypothetical protein TRIADDRAFT_58882 [Trichoplax adhaerens]EDV22357.1 hypothetical protein TRIADDRAFT_58882 [Trichoplax adhaerens]|eukprot:XP_002114901.1 hypothetical protein TRIADDRAFT_58882 [Trichoplax adhaerens]
MASSEDDEDIQAYLQNLSKKTTSKPDHTRKFKLSLSDEDIDVSSISISEDHSDGDMEQDNQVRANSSLDSTSQPLQQINHSISNRSMVRSANSSTNSIDSAVPNMQDLQSIPDDDDLFNDSQTKSTASPSESFQLQVHNIDELLSDTNEINEELSSHRESAEEIEEDVNHDSYDRDDDYSSIKSQDNISSDNRSQNSLAEDIKSISNLESSIQTIRDETHSVHKSIQSDIESLHYSTDDFVTEDSSARKESLILSRSATSDTDYSTSSDTTSSSRRSVVNTKSNSKDIIVKDAEVQTDSPPRQGNIQTSIGPSYGHEYLDPAPIATHVISPDALEAVTAYNPMTVALNNMLRDQLNLTKNFVDSNRRLYNAEIDNIQSNSYHYVTLQDTKRYIQENRRPRLTYEEALKQVLAEQEY